MGHAHALTNNNPLSYIDPSGFDDVAKDVPKDGSPLPEVVVRADRPGNGDGGSVGSGSVGSGGGEASGSESAHHGNGKAESGDALPEVTVTGNRPVSSPPVIPISPFLALYPAGTFQSYVNTLDSPRVCTYCRANSPKTGRNMLTGFAIGGHGDFLVGATVLVVTNVVGFPEAEIVEAGGAIFAGGVAVSEAAEAGSFWLLEASLAEPGSSIALGGLTGAAYGSAAGFATGLAVSDQTCN